MRVLCVNGTFTTDYDYTGVSLPEEGKAYTIRDVHENEQGKGFLFEELRNPVDLRPGQGYGLEPYFISTRFVYAPLILRAS